MLSECGCRDILRERTVYMRIGIAAHHSVPDITEWVWIPYLLGLMDASQVGVSWNGERMSPKMSLVGTYLIAGEDVFEVDSDCRDCIGHSGGCEFCIKY